MVFWHVLHRNYNHEIKILFNLLLKCFWKQNERLKKKTEADQG